MITITEFPKCPRCEDKMVGETKGVLVPMSAAFGGMHKGVIYKDVTLPIGYWKCTVCEHTVNAR